MIWLIQEPIQKAQWLCEPHSIKKFSKNKKASNWRAFSPRPTEISHRYECLCFRVRESNKSVCVGEREGVCVSICISKKEN